MVILSILLAIFQNLIIIYTLNKIFDISFDFKTIICIAFGAVAAYFVGNTKLYECAFVIIPLLIYSFYLVIQLKNKKI